MLFRKKLLIILGTLFVLGSAAAYVMLTPLQYHSGMLFLIKSNRPETGMTANNTVTFVSRELIESDMATEVQLLTSDELLSTVLVRTGSVREDASGVALQEALRKLRKTLRVTPGARSDMISVEVTADSTAHAASILEALSTLYLEKHVKIQAAAAVVPFFRDETAHARASLEQAQNALTQFDQSHDTILLQQQKEQILKSVTDLQAAYRQADAEAKDAQARNQVLEQQVSAAPPRITTQSRTLPNQYSTEQINTILVQLRNKRTELLLKYNPSDRLVEEVDQQIAQTVAALDQTRADLSKEEATDVNPLRQTLQTELLQSDNRLAGLSGRANALRIQIIAAQQELSRLAGLTGQYDNLTRAVKEAESQYQTLSTQLEQAKLNAQMDRQQMTNVEVAEAPTRIDVAEPRINVNTAAATLLGMVLVFAVAMFGGMRRREVFTPWELEGLTGVPVLGAVAKTGRTVLPAAARRALEA
jgi:polysaccharide biosynthesis protein PslE